MQPHILPIRTPRALIRRFTLDDADAVLALSNEPSARAWLPSQIYADRAHAVAELDFLIAQYSEPADPRLGPYVLAIAEAETDTVIGHVGLSPFEHEVEIGFAVEQGRHRQGIATEAIGAMARLAFDFWGLETIVAITSIANDAARRTLARTGFEWQRDTEMGFQGTRQPVVIYALHSERQANTRA